MEEMKNAKFHKDLVRVGLDDWKISCPDWLYTDCKFTDCDFSNLELNAVKFMSCRFENCTFNNFSISRGLLGGCQLIGCTFREARFLRTPLIKSSFSNAIYRSVVHKGGRIEETTMRLSEMSNCKYESCIVSNLKVECKIVEKTKFIATEMSASSQELSAHFFVDEFRYCLFQGSENSLMSFYNVAFKEGCSFSKVEFRYLDISLINSDTYNTFLNCEFFFSSFSGSILRGKIARSLFSTLHLAQANLESVEFENCDFENTDFQAALIGNATVFTHCKMRKDVKITKFQTALMKGNGGFSIGNLTAATVIDHVAELKQQYSGFWGWIHSFSVLAFFFPYLWFLFTAWSSASFNITGSGDTVKLYSALLRYIATGGVEWRHDISWIDFNWLSLLVFIFMLFYNLLRLVFLWKTKTLELQEHSTEVSANFFLTDRVVSKPEFLKVTWERLAKISRFIFWLYIFVGAGNLLYFFWQDIPV